MKSTARKSIKIVGITLSAIILLLLLAAGAVSWLFSSSGLKKATAYAIGHYSPCRIEGGDIRLSLVKTFPYIGLHIDDVTAYNTLCTTPSDTLAHFDNLTVQIDFDSYRKENLIKIEKIYLDGMTAWLYTDSCGNSNLEMFQSTDEDDETEVREAFTIPDTLNTALSFCIDRIEISDARLKYTDLSQSIDAGTDNLELTVSGNLNPDVNGKTDIKLDANGIYGLSGSDTSVVIDMLDLICKAEIKDRNVISDGSVCISSAVMTAGDMSVTGSGKTDIRFNVSGNLNDQSANGTLSVGNDGCVFKSATMDASAGQSEISVDINGKYDLKDIISAVISGKIAKVEVSTHGNGSFRMALDNIGVNCDADIDIPDTDGTANLSINTKGLSFRTEGSSPIVTYTDKLDLSALCSKNGSAISAVPAISSPSLTLQAGEETYINGWPVNITVPVLADTLFDHIRIADAALSVNEQQLNIDADCSLQKKGTIDADATVTCNQLDIATILSMLPPSVRSAIEGIEAKGLLSLKVNGSAKIKDDGIDFGEAAATISADRFSGRVNDSISTDIGQISLTAHFPGSSSKENIEADIVASDIRADVISESPIKASVSGAGIDVSCKNILDTAATERRIQANVHLNGVEAALDTISARLGDIKVSGGYTLSSLEEDNHRLNFSLSYDTLSATLKNNLEGHTGAVRLSANAKLDTTRQEFILRWKPEISADVRYASLDNMEVPLSVPSITFDYSLGEFHISDSYVLFGNSDLSISGNVRDIDAFVEKSGNMEGTLNLISDHTDMDELLGFINGYGRDDVSHEPVTPEKSETPASSDSAITEPFLVPEMMNMTFNTTIKEMDFDRHKFYNLGGDITIKDGVLVLQELGFSSDAARMQLTAIYRSPDPDNLHAALDFHLLDIDIHELIDLIPSVDTVVPMLKSFDGKAQFHLAIETDFYGNYTPKIPTLIGATAIEAKDLKVMDNEVFDNIKKKLLMSKKAENRIDSLSVELQVLRDRVELFPFLVHMDRYSAVIAGRHNIDEDFDCKYHISITDTPLPIRLGVNIEGPVADIAATPVKHIKLTKCKYGRTFNPKRMDVTDQQILEMKRIILTTLQSTVKE